MKKILGALTIPYFNFNLNTKTMKTKMTERQLIDTYILPYEDDEQKVLFYEGSMYYSEEYIEEVAEWNNIKLI
tara:strand:- start:376 stop:594 length:219 start_codon:yes stop_codon:yes gene_type:complete